ncbi:MAG: glycosyltransferase 87 family protein, partial [Christensenellales bacterium]
MTAASETLPAGWELVTYIEDDDAAAVELCDADGTAYVKITNFVSNDTRLVQSVAVQPETVYRIRANVCTESVRGELGATVSIDNYSVDGVYCYSEPVFGTTDWQRITLYVKTAPGQDSLRVALRLGGYGQQAAGSASFSGVDMRKADAPEDGELILLEEAKGVTAGASGETAQTAADDDGAAALIWMLVVTIAVAALYSILHGRVFRYEADMLLAPAHPRMELYVILAGALLLRVILSLVFVGHSTDLNCFMAWGNAMLNGGPAAFYTSGMFADYPPGYMYVLWLTGSIAKWLGLSYGSAGYVLLTKMPSILADLGAAYLVYKMAARPWAGSSGKAQGNGCLPLVLAALVAFNPVMAFISGGWGQIDQILTLLLLAVIFLFLQKKVILAGLVYGVAILVKPQALMAGPLFAVAYFAYVKDTGWKGLLRTVAAVASAVAALFVLSLPFRGGQEPLWFLDKLLGTATSYPYASIEAFNLFALLGGNWVNVDNTLFLFSYKTWGTIFICLSVVLSAFLYLKGRKREPHALTLALAFCLASLFMFGQYMHERYLFPALLLMLVAFIAYRDRRIFVSFAWLCCSLLLNCLMAIIVVAHQDARGLTYDIVTVVGSFLNL